ncbi:hypothetical protein AGLY_010643 [Aphis glycines]|uniref:Uncharacterized protein n=1 Tax=Aphis glycines TaxID=307491 RepID=A0A6G0TGC0_APHGL|nr:hypothetical protein AGLY_010643 [Aphis glycines]
MVGVVLRELLSAAVTKWSSQKDTIKKGKDRIFEFTGVRLERRDCPIDNTGIIYIRIVNKYDLTNNQNNQKYPHYYILTNSYFYRQLTAVEFLLQWGNKFVLTSSSYISKQLDSCIQKINITAGELTIRMTLIADNYLLPIFASYAVIRPNIDKQISMIIIKLRGRLQYNDFTRSDECIDFTVIITCRNNASISNFGGWFPMVKCRISFSFQKNVTENQLNRQNRFLYSCNSKTNYCKYLKFSQNVYVSVIYIQLNFQNILIEIFDLSKYFFFEYIYILKNFGSPKELENLIQVIHVLSTFANPYGLLCNHFFLPPPLKHPDNASGSKSINSVASPAPLDSNERTYDIEAVWDGNFIKKKKIKKRKMCQTSRVGGFTAVSPAPALLRRTTHNSAASERAALGQN